MTSVAPEQHADPPVTVLVARRVKPGAEAAFEAFIHEIIAAAATFPGHLGAVVFRPHAPNDHEYRVIFKFDHMSNLRRWEESDERRALYVRAEALAQGPPDIQRLTGLETWFTLPGQPAIVPPPRYKMMIVSWLGIYPLATLIFLFLGPLLNSLPVYVRPLLMTLIMIPTMTYVVMPQLTKLFARWLYPPRAETTAHARRDPHTGTADRS
jgi:hypothetical protein